MSRIQPKFEITPDILLRAYSIGLFPMAESRDADALYWVEPEERGVFPLDGLLISRKFSPKRCVPTVSTSAPTSTSPR